MKTIYLIITGLCVMALSVMPVQAFTMKSLAINVDSGGNAQIDMQYELNFVEQSAVFLKLADPAQELQSAFNSGSSQPVTVTAAGSSGSTVNVPSYASVTLTDGASVITTPTLSFERAEKVLKNYWFAPLVSPDFSPAVTTVTFPDGHQEFFYDQISIPSISHQVSQ